MPQNRNNFRTTGGLGVVVYQKLTRAPELVPGALTHGPPTLLAVILPPSTKEASDPGKRVILGNE